MSTARRRMSRLRRALTDRSPSNDGGLLARLEFMANAEPTELPEADDYEVKPSDTGLIAALKRLFSPSPVETTPTAECADGRVFPPSKPAPVAVEQPAPVRAEPESPAEKPAPLMQRPTTHASLPPVLVREEDDIERMWRGHSNNLVFDLGYLDRWRRH